MMGVQSQEQTLPPWRDTDVADTLRDTCNHGNINCGTPKEVVQTSQDCQGFIWIMLENVSMPCPRFHYNDGILKEVQSFEPVSYALNSTM
jgi:hypothetical protein